ncbi:unnamed protein product [Caenorhabditis bovis]|uniref:Arrestin C-terminal-like domain-containing protein n=1 Tax=Caenorhabditis bovis TaxID=2654633 RepID=A0A8S1FE92_9PELO|nr:unnamed protein product [Caenorhabditis bovis]
MLLDRFRQFANIRIELAREGPFQAGEIVRCNVHCDVLREITNGALFVMINGVAHSHWNLATNGKKTKEGIVKIDKNATYSETMDYINFCHVIWDCKMKGPLQTGHFAFGINYRLPEICPQNFEGLHGWIRYSVSAKFKIPFARTITTKKAFKVMPLVYGVRDSLHCYPLHVHASKDPGLIFKDGTIRLGVSIPKRNYFAGDLMSMTVSITNTTSLTINRIVTSIIQINTYYGLCETGPRVFDPFRFRVAKKTKIERVVVSTIDYTNVYIARYCCTDRRYYLNIPISATPTLTNCPVISIKYILKVSAFVAKWFDRGITIELPIEIGVVPERPRVRSIIMGVPAPQFVVPERAWRQMEEIADDYIELGNNF